MTLREDRRAHRAAASHRSGERSDRRLAGEVWPRLRNIECIAEWVDPGDARAPPRPRRTLRAGVPSRHAFAAQKPVSEGKPDRSCQPHTQRIECRAVRKRHENQPSLFPSLCYQCVRRIRAGSRSCRRELGPAEASPNSDVAYSVTVVNGGRAAPRGAWAHIRADRNVLRLGDAERRAGIHVRFGDRVHDRVRPAGESANFTFTFHIDEGTEFINTATVAANPFDPNDENDSSIAITTTGPPAQGDLYLQKSAPASAAPEPTSRSRSRSAMRVRARRRMSCCRTIARAADVRVVRAEQWSGHVVRHLDLHALARFPAGATATFTPSVMSCLARCRERKSRTPQP